MKTTVFIIVILGILLFFAGIKIGFSIGAAKPVRFIEIDMKVIKLAFGKHGIQECGLDIDGNLFFYRGQIRIPNPDRQRGCFVLNNEFRNWFAEKKEGHK